MITLGKLRSPMDIISISTYFEMYDPFKTGVKSMHYAWDMTGENSGGGDLIKLPHNGYIMEYGKDTDGAVYVITKHWGVDGVPKGHYMILTFWHLWRYSDYIPEYKKNQTPLEQGLVIGKEGATGVGTGNHLHFGVHIVPDNFKFTGTLAMRKYAVDPKDWLYCYPDQTIKYDPKKQVKKLDVKKIVTVKGELLKQEGDIFTIKGGLV